MKLVTVLHLIVMALVVLILVGYSFEPDLPAKAGPFVRDGIKAAFFIAAFLMDPMRILNQLRGVVVPLPEVK